MSLGKVNLGDLVVSRMLLGGNPFSGHGHQGGENSRQMKRYYTAARIKQTMRQAEELGIDTFVGRTDQHIMGLLMEYWDEGGRIQWIAQTAPELKSIRRGVDQGIYGGAKACYIHGGQMDNLLATGETGEIAPAIERIHEAGLPAGIAGHVPSTFEWAEENLDVDFYMCSYYNPVSRKDSAEHDPFGNEHFGDDDRDKMAATIAKLGKPAVHYKVLAAGRNVPKEAFAFVAGHLRPQDAVCVGVYTKIKADMLAEDVELFEEALQQRTGRHTVT